MSNDWKHNNIAAGGCKDTWVYIHITYQLSFFMAQLPKILLDKKIKGKRVFQTVFLEVNCLNFEGE